MSIYDTTARELAYLWMLKNRGAPSSGQQEVLCTLRDEIATRRQLEPMKVQDAFEHHATRTHHSIMEGATAALEDLKRGYR